MSMRLVQRMTLDPHRCLGCGNGNTPDASGEIGPFVDLGMEIGWNDHAYLCPMCATKAGALVGMIPPDEAKDLQREIRRLDAEHHADRAKSEELARRLKATQRRLLNV